MKVPDTLVDAICSTMERGNRVNRLLPLDGKIVVDQVLPFICVYRYRTQPDKRFIHLIKSQAAYLIVSREVEIGDLLTCIASTVSNRLKVFMILELWPDDNPDSKSFEIYCPETRAPATLKALKKGFEEISTFYPMLSVNTHDVIDRHPPGLSPLLSLDEMKASGILTIGTSVPAIYEETESGSAFALFFRKFRALFSIAVKKAAFEFIRVQASHDFDNYLMLGKTRLDNLVRFSDQQLTDISERMNFLLKVTPVNEAQEWEKFRGSNFSKPPKFTYRLVSLDPELEKRKLYKIHIERIEDPTLAHIFRDKRLELEKQLTMLEERETRNFRYIGQSLYGRTCDEEVRIARDILKRPTMTSVGSEDCLTFARESEKELEIYRDKFPGMDLKVQIRKDISGVMVSKGHLLVGEAFIVSPKRIFPLIQHEVGTHILTYCNGYRQPLSQMYAGFAGYDHLQEGLAVLSEYLVGGLNLDRLRILAGRVMAVESLIGGAEFIDTFRMLHHQYDFVAETAYNITMRVYRGGGLTKDAVYLTGFIRLLKYLQEGGDYEILFSGKFHLKHVPVIRELMHRKILKPPFIGPALRSDDARKRLELIRKTKDLKKLLNEKIS